MAARKSEGSKTTKLEHKIHPEELMPTDVYITDGQAEPTPLQPLLTPHACLRGDLACVQRTKVRVCRGFSLSYLECSFLSPEPRLQILFHFSVCFESLLWGKCMLEDSLF